MLCNTQQSGDIPSASPSPKTKKKRLLLPIGAAILLLAILVLISGALFLFRAEITDLLVNMRSPEEQQLYAYQKLADRAADKYGDIIDRLTVERGGKGTVTVDLDTDTEDAFADLESVDIAYDTNISHDIISLDLTVSCNGTRLLSADTVIDTENGLLTLSVPELNDKALKTELPELTEQDSNSLKDLLMLISMIEYMPDEELADKLLSKYTQVALGQIKGTQKSSDSLSVGDVEVDASLYTTEFTDEMMGNIIIAVLEAAREDKDLKEYVLRLAPFYGMHGQEMYDKMTDSIDYTLENAEEAEYTREVFFTLRTWTSPSFEVLGTEISSEGPGLFIACIENKGSCAARVRLSSYYGEYLCFSSEGKKENNKFTGELCLKLEEKTVFKASCRNIDTTADSLVGEIVIASQEPGIIPWIRLDSISSVTLTGSTKGAQSILEISSDSSSSPICSITVVNTPHKFSEPKLHKNAVEDTDKWMADIDYKALADRFNSIGLYGILGDSPDGIYDSAHREDEAAPDDSYDYEDVYSPNENYYYDENEYLEGYGDGYTDGYWDSVYNDSYGTSYESSAANPDSDDYMDGYDDGYDDGYYGR